MDEDKKGWHHPNYIGMCPSCDSSVIYDVFKHTDGEEVYADVECVNCSAIIARYKVLVFPGDE